MSTMESIANCKRAFFSSSPAAKRAKRATENAPKQIHHGFVTVSAQSQRDARRTNDSLHKTIHLDPVTCVLLDTPFLQRLRGLSQLGTAFLVYNNCTHSRFEHSLGVAGLAEKLCKRLQEIQPELGCTHKDVLCVKLAGLLHDIGHGPFSHVFEEFLNNKLPAHLQAHPELKELYDDEHYTAVPSNYTHEDTSLRMIDATLECLGLAIDLENLDAPLKQIGNGIDAYSMKAATNGVMTDNMILTSRDFVFIKEAIHGGPVPEICQAVGQDGFIGRPDPTSEWLYDIVSNRHSGLDVDKIDYYARDERGALAVEGGIDERMITEACVAWGSCTQPNKCFQCRRDKNKNGGRHLMICYPEKMTQNVMDFFNRRKTMHEKVYQHKTVCAAQSLVCDIFCHADPYFRLYVPPEERTGKAKVEYDGLPISRAMMDPVTFLSLNDSIIDQIYNTRDPNLAKARQLIQRWRARHLYKCVGVKNIDRDVAEDTQLWNSLSEGDVVRQMVSFHGQHDGVQQLTEDDLVVQKCSFHCGRKHQNPVLYMRFVEKTKLNMLDNPIDQLPEAIVASKSSYTRPEFFVANEIRVYCRDPLKSELANHVFGLWVSHIEDEIRITPYGDNDMVATAPNFLTQESDNETDDEDDVEDNSNLGHPRGIFTPPQAAAKPAAYSRASITPSQLYD